MNHSRVSITPFCLAVLWALPALAGNLDNAGAPSSGSAMPTLQGIYQQLLDGTTATTSGTFQEPAAGPTAGTGRSLAEIAAKLPAPNINGAAAGDVLSGKTFWGLRTDGTWGPNTGTIASQGNVTGGNGSRVITIPAGYYSGGKTATANDTNLSAGNIRSGVSIFGVPGSFAPAMAKRVNKTGQTLCWDANGNPVPCAGTGQDGEYQYGVDPAISPSNGMTGGYNTPAYTGTRFIDNSDGTVTDTLTTLIWLKNANCTDIAGGVKSGALLAWQDALTWSNSLASGLCGLTDGSTAGQWRLPNLNELHSLGPNWPPGAPFAGVQLYYYWSSSSGADGTDYAWSVGMNGGAVADDNKTTYQDFVWPVRGGQ